MSRSLESLQLRQTNGKYLTLLGPQLPNKPAFKPIMLTTILLQSLNPVCYARAPNSPLQHPRIFTHSHLDPQNDPIVAHPAANDLSQSHTTCVNQDLLHGPKQLERAMRASLARLRSDKLRLLV